MCAFQNGGKKEMGRLFGTDGVRGIANSNLSCELAMKLGRAAAMVLSNNSRRRPLFVIGMDTRISSEMLSAALTAGLCSVGADVLLLRSCANTSSCILNWKI